MDILVYRYVAFFIFYHLLIKLLLDLDITGFRKLKNCDY